MTSLRFDWQRQKVAEAFDREEARCISSSDPPPFKPVLNVGCNEDPAQLKAIGGNHVINCDLHEYDETMGRANTVDVVMDATVKPWPFEDDSSSLVVLGDIIEHLTPEECAVALSEAYRVAEALAITVPRDPRFQYEENYDEKVRTMQRGAIHITEVTEDYLRHMLDGAGWEVVEWQTVDYGFTPEGYFVLARRK